MALTRWDHVKAELRFIARSWLSPMLVTIGLFALMCLIAVLADPGPRAPDQPSKVLLAPFALVYGAVVGFWPGFIVGGIRTTWRLVRAWVLIPLTLIPLSIALALTLASGLLAAQAVGIAEAAAAASAQREWLTMSLGKIGHAGPIALIILLPALLIDLGAIALHPSVLLATFVLLLTFTLVVSAAALPSSLLSLLLLARAYVVGLRERISTRDKAEHTDTAANPAAPAAGETAQPCDS